MDFTKLIAERMNNIIPVYDIGDLKKTIDGYGEIAKTKNHGENSNNKQFNKKLEKIVDSLVK